MTRACGAIPRYVAAHLAGLATGYHKSNAIPVASVSIGMLIGHLCCSQTIPQTAFNLVHVTNKVLVLGSNTSVVGVHERCEI